METVADDPNPLAARLRGLPERIVLGLTVPVASTSLARLRGLALLDRAGAGPGLLLPRCSSIHTWGMRFPLDAVFLDSAGRPLRIELGLGPRRISGCRGAAAVLELPAGSNPALLRRAAARASGDRPTPA